MSVLPSGDRLVRLPVQSWGIPDDLKPDKHFSENLEHRGALNLAIPQGDSLSGAASASRPIAARSAVARKAAATLRAGGRGASSVPWG